MAMMNQLFFRWIVALSPLVLLLPVAWGWMMPSTASGSRRRHAPATTLKMSDWSSFEALDDDDNDLLIDNKDYAEENDSQEYKAQVGASLEPPEIDDPRIVDPIQVPAGSQLELDEDTVLGVMSAMRQELGTLFGYQAENRGVGITGGVDYVELDGPCVVVRLKGRFWHERTTVLSRVSNYLQQRIPEIIEVSVEDPWQLTNEANEVW
mmetsp:Transcript_3657/g.10061  ORF Transcript_3657/g.10061 Transcript_3657/m.10061 type:complete len:208 (-) Transcript_3657:38-661(-)